MFYPHFSLSPLGYLTINILALLFLLYLNCFSCFIPTFYLPSFHDALSGTSVIMWRKLIPDQNGSGYEDTYFNLFKPLLMQLY